VYALSLEHASTSCQAAELLPADNLGSRRALHRENRLPATDGEVEKLLADAEIGSIRVWASALSAQRHGKPRLRAVSESGRARLTCGGRPFSAAKHLPRKRVGHIGLGIQA
jgi:hypothetical protein